MKKLTTFLLLTSIIFTFASCQNEEIEEIKSDSCELREIESNLIKVEPKLESWFKNSNFDQAIFPKDIDSLKINQISELLKKHSEIIKKYANNPEKIQKLIKYRDQGCEDNFIVDLLLKGWYIYIPLLLMSLITVFIFIERWLTIVKASKEDSSFMSNIKQYINQGKIDSAKNLCVSNNTPVARMIGKGIGRIGKPLEDIKGAIENSGKLEIASLEKNTPILAIISSIAPMFGFLGTVIGVITIFHDISLSPEAAEGKIPIDSVSAGLYVKMISSAAGLVVGMLAYVAYNTLTTRIGRVVNSMEVHAVEFVDILDEPVH